MGTRNLTMVINKEGETKVAQYGQWDGYPNGQGVTCLNFLRKKGNLKKLESKFPLMRFISDDDRKEIDDFTKSIGSDNDWMTGEQAMKYHSKYPLLTRDNGANVLNLLLNIEENVFLNDESDFAMDSLFCEWAYVIDLKKETFEIYTGFNSSPLDKNERFQYLEDKIERDNSYYPIKLIKEYNLSKLPTKKQFLDAFIIEEENQ